MAAPPPAPAQRGPLITLRYNQVAPPPHAPCVDPTPDEMFEIEMAAKARNQQERDMKEASKPEDASALGKIGGFFSKAASVIDKAATDVHDSSERKVREWERKQGEEKFTLNFPELAAAGDKFIVHYGAHVMHQGQQIAGTVFVSNGYFCFTSETLKEAFPFRAVASIQRSVALKTADNGPPFIMPIPAPHVLANCIQFFMTDLRVLQFLDFDNVAAKVAQGVTTTVKGKPIDRFYNWVDHCWRRATPVPVPGVQYASY